LQYLHIINSRSRDSLLSAQFVSSKRPSLIYVRSLMIQNKSFLSSNTPLYIYSSVNPSLKIDLGFELKANYFYNWAISLRI